MLSTCEQHQPIQINKEFFFSRGFRSKHKWEWTWCGKSWINFAYETACNFYVSIWDMRMVANKMLQPFVFTFELCRNVSSYINTHSVDIHKHIKTANVYSQSEKVVKLTKAIFYYLIGNRFRFHDEQEKDQCCTIMYGWGTWFCYVYGPPVSFLFAFPSYTVIVIMIAGVLRIQFYYYMLSEGGKIWFLLCFVAPGIFIVVCVVVVDGPFRHNLTQLLMVQIWCEHVSSSVRSV